jgi:simple sugar transport system permease protein
MTLLLQYTLVFSSVLMLVALGGCFSEHSGIINIGLEGIMVIGALGGALAMRFLPANIGAFGMVSLSILAAMIMGMAYSLLLAVAAINFKPTRRWWARRSTCWAWRPPPLSSRP